MRIIPYYCSFRGLFAVRGNQNTPNRDNNALQGQPQSGLWFGKTDDLWSWVRPQGWGGPWWKTPVAKDVPSDPFLMTGFQRKMLHVHTDQATAVEIEVDFMGNGTWHKYQSVRVPSEGYAAHVFPDGFSAHWVRLRPWSDCVATASFFYT